MRRWLSKLAKASGLVLLVVVVAVLLRALAPTDFQMHPSKCQRSEKDFVPLRDDMLENFRTAIRFPTISTGHHTYNRTALKELHAHIRKSFPLVSNALHMTVETVNELSLLYTWKGRDPAASGLMFCSHLDVVPITNEPKWTHPPFSANIEDGYLYGRGTLDDKVWTGLLSWLLAGWLLAFLPACLLACLLAFLPA
eukprot:m.238706 g.238706  ORF g.238706 m.238706 type:complete len:196 (+) comp22512_c0_seq6:27-614(+)